jgi:hypothetical protein
MNVKYLKISVGALVSLHDRNGEVD